ncbi:tyrosyl-DNA phosphodiesterase 1 [Alternaria panax]|uniref:Tyrosyl-DNA phosphodiesterase 1 n=1 Tax=Alternaria panax TaxID=48097 RepID=A0AAD4NQ88_9PLEO|nr:tyrosyl-DNA phosphodiesterase 1 [Alternaria panax]
MVSQQTGNTPPAKRRKLDDDASNQEVTKPALHASLNKPISPPLLRRKTPELPSFTPTWSFDKVPKQTLVSRPAEPAAIQSPNNEKGREGKTRFLPSPIQLTKIEKLPAHQNVDAVGFSDLLGDPLIKECWNFNFLFDLDFVMQHFDSDVRGMVKVKIIHGFWKRDDGNRIALFEAAERYPNIELLSAYIPDPFGTHHSKMLILFRHDDTAQIVIHTANMIYRDWANMTQAVWKSPLLPISVQASNSQTDSPKFQPIGSGERFKVDLLRYLGAYKKRLKGLTTQLEGHDFSSIRAAFIGSVPSRQKPAAVSPSVTSFGWLGLREVLSEVPVSKSKDGSRPHIITQISSIATLGATPTWLSNFQSVLAHCSTPKAAVSDESRPSFAKTSSFFEKCEPNLAKSLSPRYSVIFPTPEEIRTSLDGYAAGTSIHWKLQSSQQQKQLEYMHPMLCHWKHASSKDVSKQEAHRGPAAPHIKTYIRFGDEEHRTIDWAMMTSANLSKQAWGDVVNKKEEIWIQSWEAGVVVWPDLYAQAQSGEDVTMIPVFGADLDKSGPTHVPVTEHSRDMATVGAGSAGSKTVIGFRMPYDLPLRPYSVDEKPWCATMQYPEPDRNGHAWGGYGR